MKKSPSRNQVEVAVQAADRGTEIFMVDSGLHRIASGVGMMTQVVSPGIYKIRFRSGERQVDELIEVKPDMDILEIQAPPVHFSTAAPIEETLTYREPHQKAARQISLSSAQKRPGRGSELFVFVRDLLPNTSSEPWDGLAIHDMDGKELAKLSDGVCDSKERYGCLNIEVDPGTYRIRVETGRLGTYEMFVVTTDGWQTQYFAMTENFSAEDSEVRRSSLRSSSIQMVRLGTGFQPQNKYTRLAEMFRIAFQSGRNVLSEDGMIKLMNEKCESPILLILGAQQLIRLRSINHTLIEKILRHFERRFGIHPDINTLFLRPGAGTPPSDLAFPEPPMLRTSWDLIVRGSRRRMSLVPHGSVSDKISDGLLTTTPWLLHRVDDYDAHRERVSSFSEVRPLVEKLIAMGERKTSLLTKGGTLQETKKLNPLEQNLANATILRPKIMVESGKKSKKLSSAQSVAQVIRQIDAPIYAIARSVKSLARKLGIDSEL